MEIYADPITVNCRKVLAGFKLMGTNYQEEKVDYFTGQFKSPEYTAINPNQSLPAVDDDGFIVWESNAILQYAADKDGKEEFYPKDLKTRTDVNRWLLWEANQWFPSCYTFLVENVVKPLLEQKPDQKILDEASPKFHQLADIIDKYGLDFFKDAVAFARRHDLLVCHDAAYTQRSFRIMFGFVFHEFLKYGKGIRPTISEFE